MKNISLTRTLVLAFLLTSTLCSGQKKNDSIPMRYYTAISTENPPRIDGKLDDACWNEGEWHGDFVQQVPLEDTLPSFPTEIKILYNTNNLFVAIRCYDHEPEKMSLKFSGRDNFGGDMTGIALDTYNDDKTAFEFNLSAAGQKIDLKHKGDYEFDMDWNAVWEGKTSLEDSAWTAEFRIPFSQVRYTNKEEQKWGLHIWRWIDRKNEESQWILIPINAPAMVFRFGELNGLSGIRNSRQVELLPYVVSGYLPKAADQSNPYGKTKDMILNGGFDAKIGLSSNFTLDATINPDFGQVEADPSVLNLTAYETFYDEKRPFFMEGREIFDYDIGGNPIYYSRRIGGAPSHIPDIEGDHYAEVPTSSTIIGAAKVTGKTDKGLSVGLMESVTASEFARIYRPDEDITDTLVAPQRNFLVARVMQEKNHGNTMLGGVFTSSHAINMDSRIAGEQHKEAYTGGLDFEHNFRNKTYYVAGKVIFSELRGSESSIQLLKESYVHLYQRPDATHLEKDYAVSQTSLSGTGGTIEGGKKGGKWRFNEEISWLSPGLDLNDIGYLRQSDYMYQTTSLQYRETEPHKYSRSFNVSAYQSNSLSFSGELTNSEAGIGASTQFNNLWSVSADWSIAFASFETRELRGGPALWMNGHNDFSFHINSNQSKNLNFNGGVHYSITQNEDSREWFAHGEINWHPISRIRISPFVSYNDDVTQYHYIDQMSSGEETYYLMGCLNRQTLSFTLRAELFITPEMSLQFYGSPYYSVGHYSEFYFVDDAGARETENRYIDASDIIENLTPANQYSMYFPLTTVPNSFDNPDFMFGQIRTNFIFRWEYLPGSVLHLVWSHDKTADESINMPTISEDFRNLNSVGGTNVFMIKLNYWLSL
ncbi:MAG: carbohydrate binding family 9 domain-containing protein [Bacteroidales bacterium]|nr:carbohydrate binding family 9 domain-containing protein [Bacteroidales bacterium]